MIKKSFYIKPIKYLLCILLLFSFGCEIKKKEKLDTKETQEAIEKRLAAGRKEKDFSLLLEKLKQKNPFSKDHLATDKYKFAYGVLVLSGIFYDEKRPLAIINEQVFGEGDMIGDKQVTKISHNEVILKDKQREYRLKTD